VSFVPLAYFMMCYQTVIGQMLCFAVECCYVVSSFKSV